MQRCVLSKGRGWCVLQLCRMANDQEKYEVITQMLDTMPLKYLRRLYDHMKGLLSFDIISRLPTEIAKMIFSYLNASSLSIACACCRKWREIANTDSLWHKQCLQKEFTKLSCLDLTKSSQKALPPPSPNITMPALEFTSQWKEVYVRAHTLKRNWREGKYYLSPLLRGHNKQVTSITCDDNIIVSGSADNSARIWNMESQECVHVLEGHTDLVNDVALKDGIVVTACSDGLVRVYDAKSGQYLKSFHGHSGSVDHIVYNGRVIISGGSDSLIKVWDIERGEILHTLSGHTDEIECLWLSEKGNTAISGSWDSTLRVWDIETGICKQLLISHTEVVFCCECVEWRVISGGGDNDVKIWDIESGCVTNTLSGHKQEVHCVQCSTDCIASASADSIIRLWNYFGSCLHILDGHIGVIRCLVMRGDILVSGGDRKRIIIWDTKNGKQLHTVYRQQTLLHRMCVTDTQIITASPDTPGTISIVNYW